jgi:hypothetical protein
MKSGLQDSRGGSEGMTQSQPLDTIKTLEKGRNNKIAEASLLMALCEEVGSCLLMLVTIRNRFIYIM